MAQSGHLIDASQCPLLGESGHGVDITQCPLMTQSGHELPPTAHTNRGKTNHGTSSVAANL